jgi:hypothetical protein
LCIMTQGSVLSSTLVRHLLLFCYCPRTVSVLNTWCQLLRRQINPGTSLRLLVHGKHSLNVAICEIKGGCMVKITKNTRTILIVRQIGFCLVL